LFERSCVFAGIQFTKHFIEFILVETKKLFRSNSNMILTRQTCGQHSGRVAGRKRRALAFCFPYELLICSMFLISKCRVDLDIGLCIRSVREKRVCCSVLQCVAVCCSVPLPSAGFRFKNVFNLTFENFCQYEALVSRKRLRSTRNFQKSAC